MGEGPLTGGGFGPCGGARAEDASMDRAGYPRGVGRGGLPWGGGRGRCFGGGRGRYRGWQGRGRGRWEIDRTRGGEDLVDMVARLAREIEDLRAKLDLEERERGE
jgi:hypothetical protein